ncbi:hypothetical protein ACFZC5_18120 [Nocardia gamkensis]
MTSPTEAGLIDVPAIPQRLTDDHTNFLLKINPCRDPIHVSLTYITMV